MQRARGGGRGAYGRSRSQGLSAEQLERMSIWQREDRKWRKRRKRSSLPLFLVLIGIAAVLWLLVF